MRQSSGTTPVSSDFWNISCSSGEISVASSFRILGDMLSGPGALFSEHFEFRHFRPHYLDVDTIFGGLKRECLHQPFTTCSKKYHI
jgi:hypothetical protein